MKEKAIIGLTLILLLLILGSCSRQEKIKIVRTVNVQDVWKG